MTTFIYFLGFIACLLVGGFSVTRRWDYTPYTALMQKTMDVKDLTEQYNAAIGDLEKSTSTTRLVRSGNTPRPIRVWRVSIIVSAGGLSPHGRK